MARTRSALLDGAARCLQTTGVRRTTMNAIAAEAGVAKATLYNHFRTKDEVLAATALELASVLSRSCVEVAERDGLAAALAHACTGLAGSSTRSALAATEPAALVAALQAAVGPSTRALVTEVLAAAGLVDADLAAVDVVLHWLAGQLLAPAGAPEAQATVLARALTASSTMIGA